MIWFVTSIYLAKAENSESPQRAETKRTFGYFFNEADAQAAVAENRCNLHECLYNFLVIECFADGIHPLCNYELWYRWNEGAGCWEICQKPSVLEGIINWAIG